MPISLTEAQQIILSKVKPLETERVALLDAVGRVLAEDLQAQWDMPQWNNSAMDGYAVRSADCQGKTSLKVEGFLPAGACSDAFVARQGVAVKIMTGAPVPAGYDAIVPVEDTDEQDGDVVIYGPIQAGAHVRFKGEDLAQGDIPLRAGRVVRPPEISLLASLSQTHVLVHCRPRVAILSTGDELVEPGEAMGPGQIINSNSYALAAAVREAGGDPILLKIARDDSDNLSEVMTEGLRADALITSAGVSAGDRDFVRDVLLENNVEELFWKVDIKPGRPTAFAMCGCVPVFSLPGNPVSAMVTFELFVRPALLSMQGAQKVLRMPVQARMAQDVTKKSGRVFLMRVQMERDSEGLLAIDPGDQNTGILTTMIKADGLAVLPADREFFVAGESVDVLLLGSLSE